MIDRQKLLKDLQRELPYIEKDILQYSESNQALNDHLKEEYQVANEAGRTAEHFLDWRQSQITQSAVAWMLTCVFVRFLEDNKLLDAPLISGPASSNDGSAPLQEAKERLVAYFNQHPTHEEREYLFRTFEQLEQYPVVAELLDHGHNPLWQIPVSADGAKRLIDFFQKIDPTSGDLVHDFTDPSWDTRFLGDLYQDLSESVRKRYALLQTPEFVENFILDFTLEKAKDTFGLEGLRLIDPTCGSGHFLLTTFERIFDAWLKREPGTNSRELAQRALSVVHGVDINPYAVAICRFRLLIAAMKAAGSMKIRNAPDFHFNLACGDSLLHGKRWQTWGSQTQLMDDELAHVYEVEDRAKLDKILSQHYHAVVGNPPYITASDKALNSAYRNRFTTCHRKYSLAVPFTERFFELTVSAKDNKPAGFMGMITTNSFMKREFGTILIEKYLPKKEVTHIVDTSGCLIPGHGTPTVILFARNSAPKNGFIRSVLGIKGEPSTSIEPEQGKVWSEIINTINRSGVVGEFVSVEDRPTSYWATHPWSLEGGYANDVMERIEKAGDLILDSIQEELGFAGITGEDDVFTGPLQYFNRQSIECSQLRAFASGEASRNWSLNTSLISFFPYDQSIEALHLTEQETRFIWPIKAPLQNRIYFGKTQAQRGMAWYEYGYISKGKCSAQLLICFPFVATHNHFALDRGGKVFNRTAPVIKLPKGTSEEDHLVLLGLLNSSVACFWGRQVFFPKGGFAEGKWEERLEWDGTKLKRFPIPAAANENSQRDRLLSGHGALEQLAQKIDSLARELSNILPSTTVPSLNTATDLNQLDRHKTRAIELRRLMIAAQEELDWLCYQTYGLTDQNLTYEGELPLVDAGERAFEIQLARGFAESGDGANAWFTRHQLTPTPNLPEGWPNEYKRIVEKRLGLMESDQFIKLIEQPEYKRRWLPLNWEGQEQDALTDWLLTFLERESFDKTNPRLLTAAQLSDRIQRNSLANEIAKRVAGTDLFESQQLVVDLLASEHVPQVAAARLKPEALSKFRAWQDTWQKQRQEDAIELEFGVSTPLSDLEKENPEKLADFHQRQQKAEAKKAKVVGDIPVPPKYAKSDFKVGHYWTLRGKLDVPKERFFSFPGCEKPGDSTLVVGWAGMDHLQRARATAAWYIERKEQDGWEVDQLLPMLVALHELIPWLKQWHNDVDPEFGERLGDFYEGYLMEELRLWNLTQSDLLKWRPSADSGSRRSRQSRARVNVND